MSDLSIIYDPNTLIREVVDNQYIQLQDAYGTTRYTLDYTEFKSAVPDGRFITVYRTSNEFRLQFTSSDNAITGMNNLLDVVGELKNGIYVPPSSQPNDTSDGGTADLSILYHSSNFIKEVVNNYIQIQDRLATSVQFSIDYTTVGTTITENKFLNIYRAGESTVSLQFLTNEEAINAHTTFRNTVDALKDGTYTDVIINIAATASIPDYFDEMYDPGSFIREVISDQYIQIQDTDSNVHYTIDYQNFESALYSGRLVKIVGKDNEEIVLQFVSQDKAISALNKLLSVIGDLKDGVYQAAIMNTDTAQSEIVDYSLMFHSSNFIKEVTGTLIQIQDRLASGVHYSVDYNSVNSTSVSNRFFKIFRSGDTTISLQFMTDEEAINAQTIFRNTLDELRNRTYNYTNNNISEDIYDSNSCNFIYEITFDDFSVQLINTSNQLTHSIVATGVVTVYISENFVKVKSEATNYVVSLRFDNNADAIEGARCLREAIRQITDRIGIPPATGDAMKSYSEVFATQSTWKLDPGVDFDIKSSMLSYWEYVCADGSANCATKVKQECQGLVEWVGSDSTGILDYINIYFNQPISGRATLISK